MKVSQKQTIIILVFILSIGLGLRLYNLTREDIWYDESVSIKSARGTFQDLGEISSISESANYPPTYYLLLKGWILVFGDTPASVRMSSVLCGLASILAIYFLGTEMFDNKHGLLASLFMAISPYNIYYSQETRLYALQVLLLIVASYFFISQLKKERTWFSWGYILTILFVIHVHFFSIFFWICLGIFHFCYLRYERIRFPTLLQKLWTHGVVLIALIPLLIFRVTHADADMVNWVPELKMSAYRHTLLHLFFGVQDLHTHWMYVTALFLFIPCVGISLWDTFLTKGGISQKSQPDKNKKFASGLFIWFIFWGPIFLFTMVSLFLHQIYVPWRYLIVILPGFYLLISYSIYLFPNRKIQIFLVFVMITLSLISDVKNYNSYFKVGMKSVARYIETKGTPSDMVLFVPSYHGGSFDYYFKGNTWHPEKFQDSHWMEFLTQSYREGHRVWLILDTTNATPEDSDFVKLFIPGILGPAHQNISLPPYNVQVYLFDGKSVS